jgi:hypothetical protein
MSRFDDDVIAQLNARGCTVEEPTRLFAHLWQRCWAQQDHTIFRPPQGLQRPEKPEDRCECNNIEQNAVDNYEYVAMDVRGDPLNVHGVLVRDEYKKCLYDISRYSAGYTGHSAEGTPVSALIPDVIPSDLPSKVGPNRLGIVVCGHSGIGVPSVHARRLRRD